jgi:hypothetical protein
MKLEEKQEKNHAWSYVWILNLKARRALYNSDPKVTLQLILLLSFFRKECSLQKSILYSSAPLSLLFFQVYCLATFSQEFLQ